MVRELKVGEKRPHGGVGVNGQQRYFVHAKEVFEPFRGVTRNLLSTRSAHPQRGENAHRDARLARLECTYRTFTHAHGCELRELVLLLIRRE